MTEQEIVDFQRKRGYTPSKELIEEIEKNRRQELEKFERLCEERRQHNGETINQLCKLGDEILKAYLPPGWTKERWVRAMSEHRGEGE